MKPLSDLPSADLVAQPFCPTDPQKRVAGNSRTIRPKRVAAYWPLIGLLALWVGLYVPRSLAGHYALRTNAFDLSVFDYALWSSLHGPTIGFVPFFGYSLFAQHFMPTLLGLLPLYGLWESPVFLICVQFAALLGAGVLLATWSWRCGLGTVPTSALLFAFLFSRPTHSAFSGAFYIESLEPMLLFAVCLLADTQRRWAYWVVVLLALGCKEDVGLYLGLFGVVLAISGRQRLLGWATAAVCFTWAVLVVLVVVPFVRHTQSLPAAYPFLSFGLESGQASLRASQAVLAMFSASSLAKAFSITGSTVFLCWAAPRLLLPGLPAFVLAASGTALALHGGFTGHYLLPVLPWLWLSTVEGWRRLDVRFPRMSPVVAGIIVLVTIANSPLWMTLQRDPWFDLRRPSLARQSLAQLPAAHRLAVQPNLIPHLPHRASLTAVGGFDDRSGRYDPEVVVLTSVGDLWPLGESGVESEANRWASDGRYRRCGAEEVLVFSRIGCPDPRSR